MNLQSIESLLASLPEQAAKDLQAGGADLAAVLSKLQKLASLADVAAKLGPVWNLFVSMIDGLCKLVGPAAVPLIEALVASLKLPAPVTQVIDAMVEQYFGKTVAKS